MSRLFTNQKFINSFLSIIILIERDDAKKKQTLAHFTAE